ncbi:DUF2167 domain-containing protein [Brevibacillus ruminantium]|uniref:DUF2167 domain-containing protein n=1 Tax=Brevibacillus ruminantium TaxID=2950604 RepID=A0ABY4WG22_9BACL|nr:DUF2167 domain-containing protein [Brevibacillus ruminantium]USG64967.1 DUF2167 domain-containing protein [Brevibacillus ruminantium]
MKRKPILSFILSLAVALGVVSGAGAETQLNWVEGGKTVDVGSGLAALDLGEDFVFLNREDTIKLQKEIGNVPSENELGSIFPRNENEEWIVVLEYEEVGYIKDEEKNKIDADAILKSYKEGTEAANENRDPEDQLHVLGWDVAPSYDEKTHMLEWSMLGEDAQKNKLINYNVQMLTRKGFVSFLLITDPANLANDKKTLQEAIIPTFHVKEGNRYEDFDASTDKVAEFGLTGLVLGGLGVALAKKAGLIGLLLVFLKKGWILILAAIGGLWKLLTGRRKKQQDEAADVQAAATVEESSHDDDQKPPTSQNPSV